MKKILNTLIQCIGSIVFGQIASDHSAINPNSNTKDKELIVSHKLNRGIAQFLTVVETSTLIYISNISSGTQTGKAINIDSVGYYSFNGKVWVKEKNILADHIIRHTILSTQRIKKLTKKI